MHSYSGALQIESQNWVDTSGGGGMQSTSTSAHDVVDGFQRVERERRCVEVQEGVAQFSHVDSADDYSDGLRALRVEQFRHLYSYMYSHISVCVCVQYV